MPNVKAPALKRSSTAFLQAVIVLIGIGALALMLWEPHLEGRNAHAGALEIYFKDPFLAYVYVGSIPFFFRAVSGIRALRSRQTIRFILGQDRGRVASNQALRGRHHRFR